MRTTYQKLKHDIGCLFLGGDLHGQFLPVNKNTHLIYTYKTDTPDDKSSYVQTSICIGASNLRLFFQSDDRPFIEHLRDVVDMWQAHIGVDPIEARHCIEEPEETVTWELTLKDRETKVK
jgi:hypothetical protein